MATIPFSTFSKTFANLEVAEVTLVSEKLSNHFKDLMRRGCRRISGPDFRVFDRL